MSLAETLTDTLRKSLRPKSQTEALEAEATRDRNISDTEATVSLASGAIMALLGLGRRDLTGLLIAGVGGAMIYRGVTKHCPVYEAIGIDTTSEKEEAEAREHRGTHVAVSFLVDRPQQELYDFWRKLENLPRIMSHLEAVTVTEGNRSHWVAKAPKIAGGKVEWDAEIVDDQPGSYISWRSLPGSEVDTKGSVRFTQAPGDRGTQITVQMDYTPPAGAIGRMVALLTGTDAKHQIQEDLRAFKRVFEVGEVPTVLGQPRGTCTGQGKRQE